MVRFFMVAQAQGSQYMNHSTIGAFRPTAWTYTVMRSEVERWKLRFTTLEYFRAALALWEDPLAFGVPGRIVSGVFLLFRG
jgi:hypothetical protein